jgi:hypothetical protein
MFLCFLSRLEPSSCNGLVASTEDNLNSSGASTEPSNASGLSTEIWEKNLSRYGFVQTFSVIYS